MPKKRKDGRYAKQVTIGIKEGKPVRKTIYGDTLKELDKNYRDFMSLMDKGIILQEQNTTFKELSELWLTNEKLGSVRDQTISTIKGQLSTVNSYIGDIRIKDLRMSHIESFRSYMIKSKKLAQWVCQVFCVSFKKIFWGGEPPHLYHPTLLNDTLLKCFGNISNRVSCQ